jgi:transcriptional regulator with XRE-family HTH domain
MAATAHTFHPASPRSVGPVDEHVGQVVRRERRAAGLTLDELAKALDLSYQQVHKYENGTNRIACGTLWQIAQVLETPIDVFFPDQMPRPSETRDEKIRRLSNELGAVVRGINA